MCASCDKGNVHLYLVAGVGRASEPLGPVKIGITGNVESRMASIQTGSPRQLKIVGCFWTPNREIARKFEVAFHNQYHDRRLSGEWFSVDPIEALELACNSFRHHLERMKDKFDGSLDDHLKNCGVPQNELQVKAFRAWRQHYAETSNVQAIA